VNEWWRFYPCIGNAVAPPVIEEIGRAMLRTLEAAGGC
jgi:site-specific DNA-cytosine methylase